MGIEKADRDARAEEPVGDALRAQRRLSGRQGRRSQRVGHHRHREGRQGGKSGGANAWCIMGAEKADRNRDEN